MIDLPARKHHIQEDDQIVETEDSQQKRGSELVRSDAKARLAAMAVHAMSRFGGEATPVLSEWKNRYPDRPIFEALASS